MDRHIGWILKVITDKLKVRADADLSRQGLTLTQSRVLLFLQSKQGEATQKEIEEYLGVSHPTVVGVVGRMEQNGFVSSWMDPRDKRNKIVRVTEKAVAIECEMKEMIEENERNMTAGLTEEQIAALQEALLTIYKNLE
ncbi:MAG: MarR family winged helix-turn-helix transcriptional regulator [Christensenellaceae bacterium]